jgi:hypothetical protein
VRVRVGGDNGAGLVAHVELPHERAKGVDVGGRAEHSGNAVFAAHFGRTVRAEACARARRIKPRRAMAVS